jgi:hypothetical protein
VADRIGIDHGGAPPAQQSRDLALATADHAS